MALQENLAFSQKAALSNEVERLERSAPERVAGAIEEPAALVERGRSQPIRLSYRQKLVVVALLGLAALVFLVLVRGILAPFVWAVVAAYVFNPAVNWLSARSRLPRALVVAIMYVVLLAGVGWGVVGRSWRPGWPSSRPHCCTMAALSATMPSPWSLPC